MFRLEQIMNIVNLANLFELILHIAFFLKKAKKINFFSDLLPEDIPGLPRHRPGEYSPR